MEYIDLLIENRNRNKKYFANPAKYARKIKVRACELLGKADVYLFGSIVRGDYLLTSDIDVLVVSENAPEPARNAEIIVALKEATDFYAPFQIHLTTPAFFNSWYKRFIKDHIRKIN